jgi:hypothetical protein
LKEFPKKKDFVKAEASEISAFPTGKLGKREIKIDVRII